ncbi:MULTISPECIES: T9SS type A sorting domain-containing protein [Chryseobacterium]|nr:MULTISPECIES: T9SS type A sorting domain-containing protein [Chryseobacterium]
MRKIFTVLGVVAVVGMANAQATLPYNETFTYPDGDLNGQGNWAVQSANATDKILVQSGVVKFDGAGEDLKQAITPVTSGSVFYSMNLKITNVTAATLADGGYFAGFGQDNTTFGGTIWTKKITDTTYKLGIEVRTAAGATTTWTTADYNINQTYQITVGYNFNSGTSDDTVNLWVNNLLATPIDTHTGTDLTSASTFFLRQDSATETPFIEIDNLVVTTTSPVVLAISDLNKTKSNFVKNTFVQDEEITFGSDVKDIKIYTLTGQVVKTASVKEGSSLNVAELVKGNYIVTGTVNNQPVSQKILKD